MLLPARDAQGERPEGVPPQLLEGIEPIAVSGPVTADAMERAGLTAADRRATWPSTRRRTKTATSSRSGSRRRQRTAPLTLANAYADAFIAQRQATVAATAESGRTGSLSSLEALEARLRQVESELRASIQRSSPSPSPPGDRRASSARRT